MKYFYIADKKSAKFIIKANVDNKLFKDNAVIAHIYPNKDGFLIYLHENALSLADKTMTDNPRYIAKAKNEHFAKRFTRAVDRTKCKDADAKAKADAKAVDALLTELENKATALKAKADAKADAEKAKQNKAKADAKADAKASA